MTLKLKPQPTVWPGPYLTEEAKEPRVERPDPGHPVGRTTALCQGRTSPASVVILDTYQSCREAALQALRRQGSIP